MKLNFLIHKDLYFLGVRFRLHVYPAWVDKRYYELKQLIARANSEEEKNALIVERAKLGDKYLLEG